MNFQTLFILEFFTTFLAGVASLSRLHHHQIFHDLKAMHVILYFFIRIQSSVASISVERLVVCVLLHVIVKTFNCDKFITTLCALIIIRLNVTKIFSSSSESNLVSHLSNMKGFSSICFFTCLFKLSIWSYLTPHYTLISLLTSVAKFLLF